MIKFSAPVIVLLLVLGGTYAPVFMTESVLDAFAREDRIYEWLTSLYFFLASVVFFAALLHSMSKVNRGNVIWFKKLSYLGLAFLFFMAAGEEISWGERVFGFEHNYIRSINVQEELNFHNLKYFDGEESVLPFSLTQLGTAFIFLFFFLIPLLCYFSAPLREKINSLIPVMPLAAGILVPANYVFQKFLMRFFSGFPEFYLHSSMRYPQAIYEIREHGYALAILASASFFLISLTKERSSVNLSTAKPL